MNEVQLLRLKSQKSLSGMPTRAASQEPDVNKWSYFEKLERLKLKIVQTHQGVIVLEDEKKPSSSTFTDFKITDVTTGVNNQQPPHPDWLAAKQNLAKSYVVNNEDEVMNLD